MKDSTKKLFETYVECIDEAKSRPKSAYVVINPHYTATVPDADALSRYLKSDTDQIGFASFGKFKQKHGDPEEQKKIEAVVKEWQKRIDKYIKMMKSDASNM